MKLLITGGTGFIGSGIIKKLLPATDKRIISKVISFSRRWDDSEKLLRTVNDDRLRVINGDIADEYQLMSAMRNVDAVIHAAAYKSVPSAEYNGLEAYRTNVEGTVNVIRAAIERDVKRVLFISSDKACDAVNLYGRTKAMGESLCISANNYGSTRLSVARYGNVLGSTGSVLTFFCSLIRDGETLMPITQTDMTRFWFDKQDAIDFVLTSLAKMKGGETFVPNLPSTTMERFVISLSHALNISLYLKEVGVRPGEKMHELMISANESPRATFAGDRYIIAPPEMHWTLDRIYPGRPVDFEVLSSENTRRLEVPEMSTLIERAIKEDDLL